jgi:hypothetical protein
VSSGLYSCLGVFGPAQTTVNNSQPLQTIANESPSFHSLLAVRDEGDIIAQSLEHQLQWADHIHIFDTGSTDETWDIVTAMAASHPQIHPVGRQPVYFSDTEVRSYLFAQARHLMMPGDWVLRCDADEFHHVPPPVFVREHMRLQETAAYHQYYDFQFTSDDLKAWNEGTETLADRARPIAERRRFFTVSPEPEPRLFRYRPAMQWPHYASFPVNSGYVARARLPIRHYPHRDPAQMKARCRLHARMLDYPPSRSTWTEADIHHWGVENWEEFIIRRGDAPGLFKWDGISPLPEPVPGHLPGKVKRLVQRVAHACVVPWLDHLRPQLPSGGPHPLPSEVQEQLACRLLA